MTVSAGLCECGCGRPVSLAKYTDATRGYVKGQPMRFKAGHNNRVNGPGPNPTGLCQCGCGQKTALAACSDHRAGNVIGRPVRFVKNHHTRVVGNGRRLSSGGYVLVFMPDHPRSDGGWVFEHIVVAERARGRPLPPGAVVHHVNDDKTDNRPQNLVVLQDNREHHELHRRRRVLRAGGNPFTQWLCASCKQPKDLARFYRRKNGWVNAECRDCERARRRSAV